LNALTYEVYFRTSGTSRGNTGQVYKGHRVTVKITEAAKVGTQIGNNSGSIKRSPLKFARIMEFLATADRLV